MHKRTNNHYDTGGHEHLLELCHRRIIGGMLWHSYIRVHSRKGCARLHTNTMSQANKSTQEHSLCHMGTIHRELRHRDSRVHTNTDTWVQTQTHAPKTGADPGFFLGGGAPLRNGIAGGGGELPLHPPPRSAPARECTNIWTQVQKSTSKR